MAHYRRERRSVLEVVMSNIKVGAEEWEQERLLTNEWRAVTVKILHGIQLGKCGVLAQNA
jgi:hypothetical protein